MSHAYPPLSAQICRSSPDQRLEAAAERRILDLRSAPIVAQRVRRVVDSDRDAGNVEAGPGRSCRRTPGRRCSRSPSRNTGSSAALRRRVRPPRRQSGRLRPGSGSATTARMASAHTVNKSVFMARIYSTSRGVGHSFHIDSARFGMMPCVDFSLLQRSRESLASRCDCSFRPVFARFRAGDRRKNPRAFWVGNRRGRSDTSAARWPPRSWKRKGLMESPCHRQLSWGRSESIAGRAAGRCPVPAVGPGGL